jgi:hypothetical protein
MYFLFAHGRVIAITTAAVFANFALGYVTGFGSSLDSFLFTLMLIFAFDLNWRIYRLKGEQDKTLHRLALLEHRAQSTLPTIPPRPTYPAHADKRG